MRVEVVNNRDRRATIYVFEQSPRVAEALTRACSKFRLNPKQCKLFVNGLEALPDQVLPADATSVWVVHGSEPYGGPCSKQHLAQQTSKDAVTVLDGADVWIDPEAITQVHQTVLSAAGNIVKAVCMPDLHQGPTGVAILAQKPMPKLPGYDIGCGMALFNTNIPATIARDKVARCMARLNLDIGEHPDDPQLGTIGGGNHFAELLVLDPNVPLSPEVQALLNPDQAVLLVHSGSRSHGQQVFSEHSNGHDPQGYMRRHIELVDWARRNRAEIARRFLRQFAGGHTFDGVDQADAAASGSAREADGGGATETSAATLEAERQPQASPSDSNAGICAPECVSPQQAPQASSCQPPAPREARLTPVIDIAHNYIEQLPDGMFLHRKGAAPSHPGQLSLLPGSRATASYVLVCSGSHDRDLNSVAHGAGRRLSRADARRRGEGGKAGGDLTRGGTVVCESKDLLLEEAPHAYKDVEAVVACMVQRSMCSIGARMLPIATYKTRAAETQGNRDGKGGHY